jgi:hypothetical protein
VARARQDGLSPHAIDRLDLGLVRASEQLQTRALTHQLNEEFRHTREVLETGLLDLIGDVRADPARLAERRQLGIVRIEGSKLSPADQASVRRLFLRSMEEEARTALIQGIQTSQDADRAMEAVIGRVVPGPSPTRPPCRRIA